MFNFFVDLRKESGGEKKSGVEKIGDGICMPPCKTHPHVAASRIGVAKIRLKYTSDIPVSYCFGER